jgi:nucleotide-binding universal stress UspA family protein
MRPVNTINRECGQERCVDARHQFIKRLLVAVDNSAQATFAVEEAARLADQLGADVVIVNVFSTAFLSSPETVYFADDIRRNCVIAGEALLAKAKLRMPNATRVQMVLGEGEPADEILNTAAQYNADLIVMGTHARGRIAQAVIGSVARSVTKRALCPVLTVAHPRPVDGPDKFIDTQQPAPITGAVPATA